MCINLKISTGHSNHTSQSVLILKALDTAILQSLRSRMLTSAAPDHSYGYVSSDGTVYPFILVWSSFEPHTIYLHVQHCSSCISRVHTSVVSSTSGVLLLAELLPLS